MTLGETGRRKAARAVRITLFPENPIYPSKLLFNATGLANAQSNLMPKALKH